MNAHNIFPQVTRIEIIDETGRAYVRYDVTVSTALQDDDRTLKVFVGPNGRPGETEAAMVEGLAKFLASHHGPNGKLTDDHPLSG